MLEWEGSEKFGIRLKESNQVNFTSEQVQSWKIGIGLKETLQENAASRKYDSWKYQDTINSRVIKKILLCIYEKMFREIKCNSNYLLQHFNG